MKVKKNVCGDTNTVKENFYMKKTHLFLFGLLTLLLVMTVISCGGNDPKALAKQTYEISKQVEAAISNPQKAAELALKLKAIEEKVDKLSEKDREIYTAEYLRLMSGN